jgi:MinD superfamily P-loop ATPase
MQENNVGYWYSALGTDGGHFVSARLGIGQENSGKLVSKVREEARNLASEDNVDMVLIDGPPGIGCPLTSAITGAGQVVIVTEASRSGLHDLERLIALLEHFGIQASCVVNKSDLNKAATEATIRLCEEHGIPVVARMPFSKTWHATLNQRKTLLESGDELLVDAVHSIWNHISNGDN